MTRINLNQNLVTSLIKSVGLQSIFLVHLPSVMLSWEGTLEMFCFETSGSRFWPLTVALISPLLESISMQMWYLKKEMVLCGRKVYCLKLSMNFFLGLKLVSKTQQGKILPISTGWYKYLDTNYRLTPTFHSLLPVLHRLLPVFHSLLPVIHSFLPVFHSLLPVLKTRRGNITEKKPFAVPQGPQLDKVWMEVYFTVDMIDIIYVYRTPIIQLKIQTFTWTSFG